MNDDEGARGASGGGARGPCPADASRQPPPAASPSDEQFQTAPRQLDCCSSPHPSAASPLPPSPEMGEGLRVSANKHRLIQVRRVGRRKLFDRARKELWLEWFAATCNLRLSAEKAGVHEKTVSRHLLNDAAFFEAAQRALQLGYFRLEARSLQEAHKLRFGQSGPARSHDSPDHALRGGLAEGPLHHPSDGPPPPADQVGRGEDYKVRILDSREGEEHFDPALAMQLLRENKRGDPGSREKRKAGRSSATAATNKEIAEALAKRLKGFALRVGREKEE